MNEPRKIGHLATRADRPERMAVYSTAGDLLATFAQDDTRETIVAKLAAGNMMLTETNEVIASL